MLCFVTVGTTKFEKLVGTILSEECLRSLVEIGVDQLRVQYGAGKLPLSHQESEDGFITYASNGIEIQCYRYKPSLLEDMEAADLIVGHAGAGTCIEVLRLKKPFIVVINDQLMDNHQLELAEKLGEMETLLYTNCACLSATLVDPKLFKLKPYPPGNPKAITDFIKARLGLLKLNNVK
ncbi:hypothetical protein L596_019527 [Steinernema carpocapsae]|uniref:UDP-N-acetylglucosamine transferase subunit ALG13 n=1 Tax=Steinernema carpocapsae TaxID=34508 RepID=A0A4U5MRA3_STECR|nr:hypothetical protein L596_019527 [Steinernema carpocapsae]